MKAIKMLGGLQWSKFRLAGDTAIFQFSAAKSILEIEYSLNVQCFWRITHKGSIVVSRANIFEPDSEKEFDLDKWTYEQGNRLGELMEGLFGVMRSGKMSLVSASIAVESTSVGCHNDVKINLISNKGRFVLEIFDDGTDDAYRLIDVKDGIHYEIKSEE
jgi:hypothetical protein